MEYLLTALFAAVVAVPWIVSVGAPFLIFMVSIFALAGAVYYISPRRREKLRRQRLSVLVCSQNRDGMSRLIKALFHNHIVELTVARGRLDAIEKMGAKDYDMLFSDEKILPLNDFKIKSDKKIPLIFYTHTLKSSQASSIHDKKFNVIEVWDTELPENTLDQKVDELITKLAS